MDVADEDSTIAAYDAAERSFGVVDTVIANAGAAPTAHMPRSPTAQLRTPPTTASSATAVSAAAANVSQVTVDRPSGRYPRGAE